MSCAETLELASAQDTHQPVISGETQPARVKLPQETLERIFELASEAHKIADLYNSKGCLSSRSRIQTVLLTCALVCKSWLPAARAILYRKIHVDAAPNLVLLYALFKYENPGLGCFVRTLDTNELFKDQSATVLSLFLDLLPNLTELSVYYEQCKQLSTHPAWTRINHLRLGINRDEDHQVEQDHFPPCLSTLTLRLCNFFLHHNWSDTTLHTVETLIFDAAWLQSGPAETYSVDKRLTPDLPNLKQVVHIRQADLILDPAEKAAFNKIFNEVCHTVETLHIEGRKGMEFFLTIEVLANFKHLKLLTFRGDVDYLQSFTVEIFKQVFPSTLRHLNVTWSGSVTFGLTLMSALMADPKFLPLLQRCPNLHYDLVKLPMLNELEMDQQRENVTRAIPLARQMAERIKQNRLSWPDSNPLRFSLMSEEEMTFLPLPLEYLEAIPDLVADVFREGSTV